MTRTEIINLSDETDNLPYYQSLKGKRVWINDLNAVSPAPQELGNATLVNVWVDHGLCVELLTDDH